MEAPLNLEVWPQQFDNFSPSIQAFSAGPSVEGLLVANLPNSQRFFVWFGSLKLFQQRFLRFLTCTPKNPGVHRWKSTYIYIYVYCIFHIDQYTLFVLLLYPLFSKFRHLAMTVACIPKSSWHHCFSWIYFVTTCLQPKKNIQINLDPLKTSG